MVVSLMSDTERVWADLHANLRSFVSRRVRNAADVDDLVQRVFLQVHRALPTLRDEDRIHAWVYQTTRHAIADYYRAPTSRREVPVGDALDLDAGGGSAIGGDDAPEQSALHELAGCLRPLFEELSPEDQDALRSVEFEGLTQVEAARRHGLSTSGMKSRVQRARTRLKAIIEDCCRVEQDRRGGIVSFEPRAQDRCGCHSGECKN
jgi:RNA polymerase sigma-70 factor, ECF subfamily